MAKRGQSRVLQVNAHPLPTVGAKCAVKRHTEEKTREVRHNSDHEEVFASAEPRAVPVILRKRSAPGDTCDLITLRNGEEIQARVVEIGIAEIKYKKCDMQEGPDFVSLKSDIFMIRYSNGRKELFTQPSTPAAVQTNGEPALHPDAIAVYILTALGWMIGIGSIPAIVIGQRVLREIRAQPGKFTGEHGVRTAMIISWIKVILVALLLMLWIALLTSFI